MVKSIQKLTREAAQLIKTVRELEYGEMFSISIKPGEPAEEMELSLHEANLLGILYAQEKVDIITVHQGEPVYAEKDLLLNGRRCRQKIKL